MIVSAIVLEIRAETVPPMGNLDYPNVIEDTFEYRYLH